MLTPEEHSPEPDLPREALTPLRSTAASSSSGCRPTPSSAIETPSSSRLSLGSASGSSAGASSAPRCALKRKAPPTDEWKNSSEWASTQSLKQALAQQFSQDAQIALEAKVVVPIVGDPSRVYETVRKLHLQQCLEREKKTNPDATVRELRGKVRTAFARLTKKARADLCLLGADQEKDADHKLDLTNRAKLLHLQIESETGEVAAKRKWLCSKSFLLTLHDDEWSFTRGEPFVDLEEAVEWLRKNEKANNAWQQWVKHWGETAKFLGLVACTSAAEVCTETFSQCKGASVKMHLHVFGHAKNKMHHYSPQSARCVFQRKIPWSNCVPGINFRDFSRAGMKEAESDNKNVWAGHYYLSCQAKLGSVFVQSTHRAFKGYAVQPQWVTKWVQAVVFVVIMFCFDASVTFYGLPPNVVLIMLSPTIFLYCALSVP